MGKESEHPKVGPRRRSKLSASPPPQAVTPPCRSRPQHHPRPGRPHDRFSLKCPAHQPSLPRHSLPAPPPAGTGWQRPHRGCPFKSLPPLIVWTNRGPCPPRQAACHLPPKSPQKCEGHLKGEQRGSQVSSCPHPHPAHTHSPFPQRHTAPCPSRGPPKFRFSPHP